jgi:hypothetical protein
MTNVFHTVHYLSLNRVLFFVCAEIQDFFLMSLLKIVVNSSHFKYNAVQITMQQVQKIM